MKTINFSTGQIPPPLPKNTKYEWLTFDNLRHPIAALIVAVSCGFLYVKVKHDMENAPVIKHERLTVPFYKADGKTPRPLQAFCSSEEYEHAKWQANLNKLKERLAEPDK